MFSPSNKITKSALKRRSPPTTIRSNSLSERKTVRFLDVESMEMEGNHSEARRSLYSWRQRAGQRAHRQSPLRRYASTASFDNKETPEKLGVEFVILISGLGFPDNLRARRVLRTKFSRVSKIQLHFQLLDEERKHIRQNFRIQGAFAKLHFANERDRRNAKKSSSAYWIIGRHMKLQLYTPEKKTPEAQQFTTPCSSSSELPNDADIADLMQNLGVQDEYNIYRCRLEAISDMDLEAIPNDLPMLSTAQNETQLANKAAAHQMPFRILSTHFPQEDMMQMPVEELDTAM